MPQVVCKTESSLPKVIEYKLLNMGGLAEILHVVQDKMRK